MITKKTELRLLARTHTRTAIAVLVGIMRSNTASDTARIAAVNSLLDRGWGRPTQMLASDDGSPVAVRITEIVNDIVDPTPLGDIPVVALEARSATQLSASADRSRLADADREEASVATR